MTTDQIIKLVKETAFYVLPEKPAVVYVNLDKLKECLNNAGLNTIPDLSEMASSNFDHIAEMAEKLSTGNVSHQGRTILGLARRNAEFIRKHYRSA